MMLTNHVEKFLRKYSSLYVPTELNVRTIQDDNLYELTLAEYQNVDPYQRFSGYVTVRKIESEYRAFLTYAKTKDDFTTSTTKDICIGDFSLTNDAAWLSLLTKAKAIFQKSLLEDLPLKDIVAPTGKTIIKHTKENIVVHYLFEYSPTITLVISKPNWLFYTTCVKPEYNVCIATNDNVLINHLSQYLDGGDLGFYSLSCDTDWELLFEDIAALLNE